VIDSYLLADEAAEPKKNSAELGSATNSP
jgi:hypothetical protein